MGDLVGKVVKWENDGQWFTAEITGTGVTSGSWCGTVVDPGNYVGMGGVHPYFEETPLAPGQHLPNLAWSLIDVVDSDG